MVTAYSLAFGSLLLVGGRLGDMYSRKWVFITGLIGFAVASAIGGAAISFGMLVAARALQGAFGAILAPSALGTLVSTFQDPRERGRAFGVFGSVAAGGGAIGLFLFLTYYLQIVKRESPLTSGLLFLPMVACILLSSNLSSIVFLPRLGPRVLIATGMVLGAAGTAYLTQLTVTSSYARAVLPALLIMGLGFGMIFAPAINTATAGVAREDSGVASALVNTMQQVGGSIGTSALSTIALTATASYLVSHHTGPLAPAIAATHGYTVAFAVSAAVLGVGVILAIVLLPSRHRLEELRNPPPAPAPAAAARAPAPQLELKAIPVALICCSPVTKTVPGSTATSPGHGALSG